MGGRIWISSSNPPLFMIWVSWYVVESKIFSYGVRHACKCHPHSERGGVDFLCANRKKHTAGQNMRRAWSEGNDLWLTMKKRDFGYTGMWQRDPEIICTSWMNQMYVKPCILYLYNLFCSLTLLLGACFFKNSVSGWHQVLGTIVGPEHKNLWCPTSGAWA